MLDEEEFKKLTLYITDFLTGMENVPQEVKAEIVDEILIDRAVEILSRKNEEEKQREPQSLTSEAAEELREEDLFSQADFEDM